TNPNNPIDTTATATVTKTHLNTGNTAGNPLSFPLQTHIPTNETDHTFTSLTLLDPDSHAVVMGTDNNLPGNIVKFASGGNADVSPKLLGGVTSPFNPAIYNPPNNQFPF